MQSNFWDGSKSLGPLKRQGIRISESVKWPKCGIRYCCYSKCLFFYHCREIVLGDHKVGENPDCEAVSGRSRKLHCVAPIIKKKIAKSIIHEKYSSDQKTSPYDVALIRLDEPIPLHSEGPRFSSVVPICLPWSLDNLARNLTDGDPTLVTGWGRITNNFIKANRDLRQYNVAERVLQKLELPIANSKCTGKKELDYNIQFCAGGDKGELQAHAQ